MPRPASSAQKVIATEFGSSGGNQTPVYLTFYAFASVWVIVKTGTSVGYYVTPEHPVTLPPDTYDFILQDTLPLTGAIAGGTNVWLWGEVADAALVRELYGDVDSAPPSEPQL